MSREIIALVVGALILGPAAAQATIIDGSFSGTLSSGTDFSGVFGDTPGSDLTNDAITGTFVYDTSLLSQVVSGSQNTATGTGLGALTVTITINGTNYTFTDNTSSSVFVDDSASEVTIQNANSTGGHTDNFSLDAEDIITPFITSTDLTQTFSTSDPSLSSTGSFFISDTGPTNTAGGAFTISTISTTTGSSGPSPTPEPASMAVLAVGLAGIAGARRRRAKA